ncbi:hypothetical protein HK102_011953 [Quaeritorhiza haematococci]|nr:hypothetical protein HK102_011953 [Quaeritorhiza haematococci]
MSETATLTCLLLGQPAERSFVVQIPNDTFVSQLKDIVHKRLPTAIASRTSPPEIDLFRVDEPLLITDPRISESQSDAAVQWFGRGRLAQYVENKFKVTRLTNPLENIGSRFDNNWSSSVRNSVVDQEKEKGALGLSVLVVVPGEDADDGQLAEAQPPPYATVNPLIGNAQAHQQQPNEQEQVSSRDSKNPVPVPQSPVSKDPIPSNSNSGPSTDAGRALSEVSFTSQVSSQAYQSSSAAFAPTTSTSPQPHYSRDSYLGTQSPSASVVSPSMVSESTYSSLRNDLSQPGSSSENVGPNVTSSYVPVNPARFSEQSFQKHVSISNYSSHSGSQAEQAQYAPSEVVSISNDRRPLSNGSAFSGSVGLQTPNSAQGVMFPPVEYMGPTYMQQPGVQPFHPQPISMSPPPMSMPQNQYYPAPMVPVHVPVPQHFSPPMHSPMFTTHPSHMSQVSFPGSPIEGSMIGVTTSPAGSTLGGSVVATAQPTGTNPVASPSNGVEGGPSSPTPADPPKPSKPSQSRLRWILLALALALVTLAVVLGVVLGTRNRSSSDTTTQSSPSPTRSPVSPGSLVREYVGHTGRVWDLWVIPETNRIFSAGQDTKVIEWDAFTGAQVFTYEGQHDLAVDPVYAMGPPNNLLFSGSDDGTVVVWSTGDNPANTNRKGPLLRFRANAAAVNALGFLKNARKLLTAGSDNVTNVYDIPESLPSPATSGSRLSLTSLSPSTVLRGHRDFIDGLYVDQETSRVYTASGDRTGLAFDISPTSTTGGSPIATYATHRDVCLAVWAASINTEGGNSQKRVYTVGGDRAVREYDEATGGFLRELNYTGPLDSVMVSRVRDNSQVTDRLFLGSNDNSAVEIDVRTWSIVRRYTGHKDVVTRVFVVPEWNRLFTASLDGTLREWGI